MQTPISINKTRNRKKSVQAKNFFLKQKPILTTELPIQELGKKTDNKVWDMNLPANIQFPK